MTDQQELLFKQLDAAIVKYRAQNKRLKNFNYAFRIATLLLAAGSTVLLGLSVPSQPNYLVWSRNVALAFGALGTFLVSLSAFWNLEAYWLKSKVLYSRLRALRERCEFLLKEHGHLSSEQTAAAFGEYRALMDSQIEYWERAADQAASQPQLAQSSSTSAT